MGKVVSPDMAICWKCGKPIWPTAEQKTEGGYQYHEDCYLEMILGRLDAD